MANWDGRLLWTSANLNTQMQAKYFSEGWENFGLQETRIFRSPAGWWKWLGIFLSPWFACWSSCHLMLKTEVKRCETCTNKNRIHDFSIFDSLRVTAFINSTFSCDLGFDASFFHVWEVSMMMFIPMFSPWHTFAIPPLTYSTTSKFTGGGLASSKKSLTFPNSTSLILANLLFWIWTLWNTQRAPWKGDVLSELGIWSRWRRSRLMSRSSWKYQYTEAELIMKNEYPQFWVPADHPDQSLEQ